MNAAFTPSPLPSEIIVAFSGGKDSLALLDFCSQNFSRIHAFFMWCVRGLSFQEATLRWAEDRYQLEIYRVPHFSIPAVMDNQVLGWSRPSQRNLGRYTSRQIDDHVRRHFGCTWIASGERKQDSLQRRGMLTHAGPWDQKRLHHYPIGEWSTKQVYAYLKAQRIPIPAEYAYMKRSVGGFRGEDMAAVAKYFPADYARIVEVFPFVEAITKRWELFGRAEKEARTVDTQSRRTATARTNRAAKVRNAHLQADRDLGGAVQPAQN